MMSTAVPAYGLPADQQSSPPKGSTVAERIRVTWIGSSVKRSSAFCLVQRKSSWIIASEPICRVSFTTIGLPAGHVMGNCVETKFRLIFHVEVSAKRSSDGGIRNRWMNVELSVFLSIFSGSLCYIFQHLFPLFTWDIEEQSKNIGKVIRYETWMMFNYAAATARLNQGYRRHLHT